jgi:aspartyl/glutamyl-tRNA(Asn/Gln) amidotransferase C subunit
MANVKLDVDYLANLSALKLSRSEAKKLSQQLGQTLKTIALLEKLDTTQIPSTFQVTGLKNITRLDKLEPSRGLTQKQALKNARKTYKGYFVIPAIFS